MMMTRRTMLAAGIGFLTTAQASMAASDNAIHVVKDANCGCCNAWIKILRKAGFSVTHENSSGTRLFRYKLASGIPRDMTSCHTAEISGYMIEGHVPVADIRRLLAERPDAIGLTVPGMPYGSPGMGPEDERDAYDVHLIRRDGSTEVFTSYDGA